MIEVLYINRHHSTMIENLQNGGKNKWVKTCCNPSLGLTTKARAYEGAGQV